ncbi:protoplasts-secreted [Botryosphaeria dothidea]
MDSKALAACKTYTGDVTIATSATGDFSLDDIEEITGTFTAFHVDQLTGLSADSLKSVGNFNASQLTILSSLNFPRWTSVEKFELLSLPSLSQLSFTTGLSGVDSLDIQNTFLSTVDGIEPSPEVSSIRIRYNNYMQDIDLPVERITDSLEIASNGDKLRITLKKLESAGSITIRNASEIEVPTLTSVDGSLTIGTGRNGRSSDDLDLSKLETVGGDLAIIDESKLTSIDLSALRSVGGDLTISSTNVSSFDFPSLETVEGTLFLNGTFSEIHVPAIKSINDVTITSPNFPSNDSTPADIAWLDSANGIVKNNAAVNTSIDGQNSTATDSSSSSSSTSSSSASASASATDAGAAATATSSGSTVSSASGTAAPTTVAADSGSSRAFVGAGAIGGALAVLLMMS